MLINPSEEDKKYEWKIGNMKIEPTETYTYLGECIHNKCDMKPHLEEKRRKMTAIANNITTITKDEVFKKTRPKTTIDLYEKILIPALTYGSETWTLNKTESEITEDIQTKNLTKLMKIPTSTPKIATIGETGCLQMKHRTNSKKLNHSCGGRRRVQTYNVVLLSFVWPAQWLSAICDTWT